MKRIEPLFMAHANLSLTFYRLQDDKVRYKCPSCPHEARNPAELRQHVLGKHEGVTHACNLCSFTTTHPSSLKRHRLNQHAELRFACDAHSNSSNGGSLGAVTAGFPGNSNKVVCGGGPQQLSKNPFLIKF